MNIFDISNTLVLLYRYAQVNISTMSVLHIHIFSKKRENYILETIVSSPSRKMLTLTYFHLPNMRF